MANGLQNLLGGAQASPERSTIDQIGLALQGFGAGVGGQGQQFQQQLRQERQDLQKLDADRRRVLLEDSRTVLQTLRGGDTQGALNFIDGRIGELKRLGGDPQDTQQIRDQIAAGDTQGAIAELETLDRAAVNRGMLPAVQAQETFEQVTDAQGNIVGQMSSTTGKVVADPRARKAAVPSTAIGKARQDLKSGFITQSEFNTIGKAPKEFQTSVGKLISDKKLATEMYGPDSEQVKAISAALNSESKGEAPKLTDIGGLRKEFTKQSGSFIDLRDSAGKIRASAANPSPAGDIVLLVSFMKMIDPGSVVREGEFATAENSAGVPERIRGQYNKLVSGERLTDQQRKDFTSQADSLFGVQLKTHLELENAYRTIAKSSGINPDDVVVDFVGDNREQLGQTGGVNKPISEMSDEELKALAAGQ